MVCNAPAGPAEREGSDGSTDTDQVLRDEKCLGWCRAVGRRMGLFVQQW